MPNYLQWLSAVLPLTYGVEGLRDIMLTGKNLIDVGVDLAILLAYAVFISALTMIALRRGVKE
jgi:ABC-2 type transport system permease protein